MFNPDKFASLSPNNRLKKLAYALRDQILHRQTHTYYKEMIDWLNTYQGHRFKTPEYNTDFKALYQELIDRITKDDPYQEKVMFDTVGQKRTVFNITLILDNIRSPFNVGSFFRTSESLGVKNLWLIGITPTPDSNPKINRSAKDAIIPHTYFKDTFECIKAIESIPTKTVLGIEKTPQSQDLKTLSRDSFPPSTPLFLIFGNEEFGISKDLLDHCENIIHIPLLGMKNSINVSVAAGIVLYTISCYLESID